MKNSSVSSTVYDQRSQGDPALTPSSPKILNSDRTLKIGSVVFSLQSSKKKGTLVKLLQQKYSRPASNLRVEQKKLQKFHESDFILQAVFLTHYHAVLQVDQQRFTLRKSDYKHNFNSCGNLFKMDHFWKISFNTLKTLDLNSCKISNLEALSFANMPQLIRLQIYNNKLYSLNSLNKSKFNQLEYISCFQNPLIEFSSAFRANLPKLKRIIADSDRIQNDLKRETYKANPDQHSLYRMENFFKLENLLNMFELKMNTRKRILPKRIKQAFKTINPDFKLKIKLTNQELMARLQRLGGIGTVNDPETFRRFLAEDVEPVLQDRERNPHHANAILQIRQGLLQRLRELEMAVGQRPDNENQNGEIGLVNGGQQIAQNREQMQNQDDQAEVNETGEGIVQENRNEGQNEGLETKKFSSENMRQNQRMEIEEEGN